MPVVIEVDQVDDGVIRRIMRTGGVVFRMPWDGVTFQRQRYGVEFPAGTKTVPQGDTPCFILPDRTVVSVIKLPLHPAPAYGLQLYTMPIREGLPSGAFPYFELSLATKIAIGNAGGAFDCATVTLPEMQRSETCNAEQSVCWYLPTGMKIHVIPLPVFPLCWIVTTCNVFTENVEFYEFPETTDFYSGAEENDVPEAIPHSWRRG